MKLYLAARYSRKHEIKEQAAILAFYGCEITSTWFNEPHDANVTVKDVMPELLQEYIVRDLAELMAADLVLFWAEEEHVYNKRGGRHVEFGYALAVGKPIAVLGPRENMFHFHPHVTHYTDLAQFIATLEDTKV